MGQPQHVFCGAFEKKEINGCLRKELTLPNLEFLFLKTIFEQASKSFTIATYSLMEFLDSLSLCR